MRGKKLIWAPLFLALLLGSFWRLPEANAAAGINKEIGFQGKVVNNDGTNVADSSYSFTFSLYSVDTGGTAIWTETKSIAVHDGIFQTNLGSVTPLPASSTFDSDTLYLGVEFNSDGEMSPRIRLTAAPYAINSDLLDGLEGADLLRSNASDTFAGSNDQTLTLASDLSGGARSANLLTISQANDATYNFTTGALLGISNSDTGSSGNLLSLTNSGSGAALLFAQGSSVANGIQWGSDANAATLYRSANDTLKTDDSFVVGSALNVTGTTTLATSLSGLLKATSGVVSAAAAGTDYLAPGGTLFTAASTSGSSSTISQGGTLTIAAGTDTTTTGNGSGSITIANTSTLGSVVERGATASSLVNLNGGIAVAGSTADPYKWTGSVSTTSINGIVGLNIQPTISSSRDSDAITATLVSKPTIGDSIAVPGSYKHVHIQNTILGSGASLETQYGLYVDSLASANSNYAIYLAGTGASNGITLGADTNIYRSTTNTLKTDDSFIVGGTSLDLLAQGDLRLYDSDSSNYVGFQAPTTVSGNLVWTLPNADGSAGQCLATNSGVLSWADCGGGSGAPTTSQYLTLALDGTLSAERVLTGTANQVILTDGGANGNLTLSLPQSIATSSTVQFGAVGIGAAAGTNALLVQQAGSTDIAQFKDADSTRYVAINNSGQLALYSAESTNNALRVFLVGEAAERFSIDGDGSMTWGDGTNPSDIRLYRGAASELYFDDLLAFSSNKAATAVDLKSYKPDVSGAQFLFDTSATVSTASLLVVRNNTSNRLALTAAGQLQLPTQGATGGILLGGDASFYRSEANTIRTDDTSLYIQRTGEAAGFFRRDESSRAVALYRSSNTATDATVIGFRLNDSIDASEEYAYIGGIIVDPSTLGQQGALIFGTRNSNTAAVERMRLSYDGKLYFGTDVAIDTNLYRSTTNTLKTDDSFIVGGTSLDLLAQGDLRLYDSDSSNYVGFQAPTTVSGNLVWTLPNADGSAGQCLATNSGVLSWADCGGGSGAPTTSQYLTLALDGTLSAERVLTGTANQVILTDGGANGNLTLSLPQSIATSSTVQFAKVGIGLAPGNNWLALNTTASPTYSQAKITANNASALSLLAYGVDNVSVGFDVDFVSGAWVARDTSVAWLYKGGGSADVFSIQGSAGNTVGQAPAAASSYLSIDLTTAATTLIGATSFTKVNAASGSANAITLSGTLGIFNGSDTFNGLNIAYTNANHTGSSNAFNGINIGNITGDAEATETGVKIGTGWDTGITSASAVSVTYVNAANGSANALTLSGTLGAFNGSDTFRGLYLNYTNANHTSTSNNFYGIDVANITGDAEASEYALNIGSGWDATLNLVGAASAVDFRSAKADSAGGTQFLFNTSAAVSTASLFAVQENTTTQFAIDASGVVYSPASYSATVGVTNRDLYIDSSGKIGYVSSSARYKQNIADLQSTDWIYNLRPVTFEYTSDITHTEQIGLIAEEVENTIKDIFPSLVSYSVGDPTQVETVNYSQLIVPLLSQTQALNTRLSQTELAVANLQSSLSSYLTDSNLTASTISSVDSDLVLRPATDHAVRIEGALNVQQGIAGASITLGNEVRGRGVIASTEHSVYIPTTAVTANDSVLITPILPENTADNEPFTLFRGTIDEHQGFYVQLVPETAKHEDISFDWLIVH